MLIEDIVITYIPVFVFGFAIIWFIIDIKSNQRNIMKYQMELAELMKIKNHVTQPAEPKPNINPEKKELSKEEIDRINIKKAIIKLVDKL